MRAAFIQRPHLEPPILHRKANDCTGKNCKDGMVIYLRRASLAPLDVLPLDVLPLDAVLID